MEKSSWSNKSSEIYLWKINTIAQFASTYLVILKPKEGAKFALIANIEKCKLSAKFAYRLLADKVRSSPSETSAILRAFFECVRFVVGQNVKEGGNSTLLEYLLTDQVKYNGWFKIVYIYMFFVRQDK